MNEGDVINGVVKVTTTSYNGFIEASAFDLQSATVTSGGTVTPTVVSIEDLNKADNYNKYESVLVKIVGATVTSAFSDRNATIAQGANELALRGQDSEVTYVATEGANVNVTGWLSKYNSTLQFQIFTQSQIEELNYNTVYLVPNVWDVEDVNEKFAVFVWNDALAVECRQQSI